jgi:hypothetical protein
VVLIEHLGEHAPVRSPKPTRCSFCGLPESHARRIIHGQAGNICVACVAICQDIIALGELRVVLPRWRTTSTRHCRWKARGLPAR